jgi:hypothetical protein
MVRKCEEKRFAKEYYNEMCDVVPLLSQLLNGVTLNRLRLTAWKIAERNNLQQNFNNQAKLARNTCAQVFLSEKYKTKCQKSKPTALGKILVLTFILWKLNKWFLTRAFWVLNLYSISINLDFKTKNPPPVISPQGERQWTSYYRPCWLLSFKNDTITQSRRSLWKFLCVLKFGLHFRNLAHICRI